MLILHVRLAGVSCITRSGCPELHIPTGNLKLESSGFH